MFIGKPAHQSNPRLVGLDLMSVANVLRDDSNPDRVFTQDELKQIEDYVAERLRHLKQLRKQAPKK